jgi:TonB family protein
MRKPSTTGARLLALSGALAGLSMAGATLAAPKSEPAAPSGLQPDWLAEPSFQDRAKAYPPEALKQGVNGRSQISCSVETDGRLTACAVVSETPAGMGFGQASLSLAEHFRMKPEAVRVAAAGGPKVTIPIRWAMVTSPDWLSLPSGGDMENLYPDHAKAEGVPGTGRVRCQITTEGRLADCFVVSETPLGLGFGAATVKLAGRFRMRPMMLDGAPVAGAVVEVPVRWSLGDERSLPLGGEIGIVLTVLKDAKSATPGGKVVGCPTAADAARKCQAHLVSWAESPPSEIVAAVMEQNQLSKGASRLICSTGEDGALSDCTVVGVAGPGEEAAMRALAAHLKAAPMTRDMVSTLNGKIILLFDWAELSAELKRAKPKHH